MRSGSLADITRWLLALACSLRNAVTRATFVEPTTVPAEKDRNVVLALRIRKFQFRDIRPKAASEIASPEDASKLLGHTNEQITQKVYWRVGEVVKPTR